MKVAKLAKDFDIATRAWTTVLKN